MNMVNVSMQSEISTSIPITLTGSHPTEKKIKINKANTVIENITGLYLGGWQSNGARLHTDAKLSL